MNDFQRVGREAAKAQQQIEARKKPDRSTAFVLTLIWVVAGFLAFNLNAAPIGWMIVVVAVALVIAGIFWRPLRSGDSPIIVYAVPVWGIVAQFDRVGTSQKLRVAKIYNAEDKTKTLPATTYKQHGDTFVRFDGGGEAGMNPDHIKELLEQNACVWRCRSFAVSEDPVKPGKLTLQLSLGDAVRTELDNAITGVVA